MTITIPTTEPDEKFKLFVDIGIITVPNDYMFEHNYVGNRFPELSRIPKAGNKYHVRIFRQTVNGLTTSKERMEYLDSRKAIYLGEEGGAFIHKQMFYQLPEGYSYTSFVSNQLIGHPEAVSPSSYLVVLRKETKPFPPGFYYVTQTFGKVWGWYDAFFGFFEI